MSRTAYNAVARVGVGQGAVMDWARVLAYATGTVDQELLARNEYLAAGNPYGQKTESADKPVS